ncbi:MAG: ABC transporter permease [Oscillospiraceae bacterium]|jgi:ABC-2 type transport system permease protein|nr:ABC transporter permease [Oscillospiraceae bacterium]
MTVFHTALRRIFRQPVNWAFLLLFPMIFILLINFESDGASGNDIVFSFGVCDLDQSVLSQTLVKQMEKRYDIREVAEPDISAVLTDSEVPWILVIREGYGRDILAGNPPKLEGHSLKISEVSALAGVNAESITRALTLLGTDDPAALAAWEEAASVALTELPGDNWEGISFWFSMYGFVAIFTSYFVVKALSDDKVRGMPDRLGVLPITPRRTMAQSALAAFLAVEVTAALMVVIVQWQAGSVPHPLHIFLLLSLYNLFAVNAILAIMSIARDLGAASVVMTMLSVIVAMLGGLFWPLDMVPEFMQKAAWFSPGFWLSRGLENMKEITFEGFGMPMLFLAAFAAVALLLGGWKRIQPLDS